jgi:hypothetical protein
MNLFRTLFCRKGLLLLGILLLGGGALLYRHPWKQWSSPEAETPITLPPIAKEVMVDVTTLPNYLRPYVTTWQGYVAKIRGGDNSLTYARDIKLALSTAGENTWFINSEAGIYEDATQKKLLMRKMKGHLENMPAPPNPNDKQIRALEQKSSRQLELEAPFARYDAEKEIITLQGRSRVILYK